MVRSGGAGGVRYVAGMRLHLNSRTGQALASTSHEWKTKSEAALDYHREKLDWQRWLPLLSVDWINIFRMTGAKFTAQGQSHRRSNG